MWETFSNTFFTCQFLNQNYVLVLTFTRLVKTSTYAVTAVDTWFSNNSYRDILITDYSPVKRQKGGSKRMFQENKARQIFRKTNISYPLIRTRFLETPVLRFALLAHYRRNIYFFELLIFSVYRIMRSATVTV